MENKRDDYAFRHEVSVEEAFILPEITAYLPGNFNNLEETEAAAARKQAVIDRRTDRQLARGAHTWASADVRVKGWSI